jgi:hypothetical protein
MFSFMGVGYAYFSSDLSIFGQVTLDYSTPAEEGPISVTMDIASKSDTQLQYAFTVKNISGLPIYDWAFRTNWPVGSTYLIWNSGISILEGVFFSGGYLDVDAATNINGTITLPEGHLMDDYLPIEIFNKITNFTEEDIYDFLRLP